MDKLLIKAIKDSYGFNIVSAKDIYSYHGGVSEITTSNGEVYIFKYLGEGLLHHQAVVEFCQFVEKNITVFVTQKFIPNKKGEFLQHLWGKDYCYIVEKKVIIHKTYITPKEQRLVGHLMRIFHTKLKDFDHPGLGNTNFMRNFSEKELKVLKENFPKKDYEHYIDFFDYQKLGLELTLLHGDWHGDNMSFSNPPFLFDLDTLCRGSRVEEIARSITHWNFKKPKKEFFENIVKGYEILPQNEINLIPKLMVLISYKKYAEFKLHGDMDNADGYKYLAEYLKKEFNLN